MNKKIIFLAMFSFLTNAQAMLQNKYEQTSTDVLEAKHKWFVKINHFSKTGCPSIFYYVNMGCSQASQLVFYCFPELSAGKQIVVLATQLACPLGFFFSQKEVEKYLSKEIPKIKRELKSREVRPQLETNEILEEGLWNRHTKEKCD